MITSVVPGERVPRHRLIRNLIRLGEFEEAATEIRIFESDFREEGPIAGSATQKFGDNKYVLNAYAQVGVKWFKYTGQVEVFDAALDLLRSAEERLADPEISSMITRATRIFTAAPAGESSVLEAAEAAEGAEENGE